MPYTYKREPLTSEESKRLEQACSTFDEKLIIWTLLDTGLRIQELISLTPSNLDWQSHQLVIRGKGKKRRVVPMTPRVQSLLEGYFANSPSMPFGKRWAQHLVHEVANKARIARPCSPHVLRHTFSIRCIKNGISLPALKEILGHSNLSTTFIYLNMQPEAALQEFRDKF